MAQDEPANEVVVVNDGDDLSGLPSDRRVKYIKTSGGIGPTKGRELGISVLDPSTEAVCYLDDDDELMINHVRELSAKMVESGAEFAFSRAVYRHPDGTETEDPEPDNHDPNKRYYDPDALLTQNIAPVSSFIHTVRAHREIGGWDTDLIRMEDWDYWARMFIQFGRPAYVPKVTNIIYKGLGSNRTDSNEFVYSMSCSWRDIVADRVQHLSYCGTGRVSAEVRERFRIPKVGVVMPVFNAERYLSEALDSMDAQTYRDFEVIAVDDGSTDGSKRILESRSGVRVFSTGGNVGVARALNLGLLMSRSEYVARMDADDVSMPERFERQVRFLDDNQDVGIVGSRFWSMSEDLKVVNWSNEVPTSPSEIERTLLDTCCIGHPTVMMRRRVVETIGGYRQDAESRSVEDYEMWLRAVSKGIKIANLPDYLLRYREHGGQVTARTRGEQGENFVRIRDEYRSLSG